MDLFLKLIDQSHINLLTATMTDFLQGLCKQLVVVCKPVNYINKLESQFKICKGKHDDYQI